ncbi:TIR domain-containing protein [Alginatibacterium sediminis]|uniref:TIR domain-containing protein n=1 Tax=Alginatibacterium sediminis TaxID=2164068 RepID=UPI001313F6EB|nr:toll/interleukin-1 receptor domain-containing protein [Alginatibacterium sediminis]
MSKIKLFISYAHENENHKDTFVKFLATFKNNGLISEWNDRKLLAGSKLNDEIIGNLEEADAVCLLITQDFLNSYYCVQEELKRALDKANSGTGKVFPIIVDHCMWLETEIKDFTCVPKDGQPITEYENENKGWFEVANQLKSFLSKISEEKVINPAIITEEIISKNDIALTDDFKEYLSSTQVNFQHTHKEFLTLEDTFVHPDLKKSTPDISKYEVTKKSKYLCTFDDIPALTLLVGEEQVGKTSLAKTIYSSIIKADHFPVLLNGKDISSSQPERYISKKLGTQYLNLDYDSYMAIEKSKVLILDNLHEVRLNTKAIAKLLENLESIFDRIILISEDSIQYKEEVLSLFDRYDVLEILPFGHERRDELLRTWYSIGRSEQIENCDLVELVDTATMQLNSIIRKNIVPPKPIFIIMILQALESAQSQDYSLTSHGFCYQMLIQENLRKAKIKTDQIDKYINYLTQLAYYIYKTKELKLSDEAFLQFKEEYSQRFILDSHEDLIEKLVLAKLIKVTQTGISIKYKYIFYFYVAKYMSDHDAALDFVEELCSKLHTEQHSNILIFITHHTRNNKVIDKIIQHTLGVFPKEEEAKLDRVDTEFLKDFISEIPKLVIKQRNNVHEARKGDLIQKDLNQSKLEKVEYDHEEALSLSETLRDVTRSVRSVEIIGQIIKNRHASIEQEQLKQLGKQAINVGLRFLGFYLKSTRNIQGELIEIIHTLIEQKSTLSNAEIAEMSKKTFIHLIYTISLNVIRKISTSIGHRELIGLFNSICVDAETPAYSLVNANIQLEFKSNKSDIPKKEIEQAIKVVKGSFLADHLLKRSVLEFQYINYISYKDKSWISEKLDIPLEIQDKYSGSKRTKLVSKEK